MSRTEPSKVASGGNGGSVVGEGEGGGEEEGKVEMPDEEMTLQSKHRHKRKGQGWISFVGSGSSVVPPLLCLSATCEASPPSQSNRNWKRFCCRRRFYLCWCYSSSVALPSGQTQFICSRAANLSGPDY